MFRSRISAAFLIFLWAGGFVLDKGDVGWWYRKASNVTMVSVQMNYSYFLLNPGRILRFFFLFIIFGNWCSELQCSA